MRLMSVRCPPGESVIRRVMSGREQGQGREHKVKAGERSVSIQAGIPQRARERINFNIATGTEAFYESHAIYLAIEWESYCGSKMCVEYRHVL